MDHHQEETLLSAGMAGDNTVIQALETLSIICVVIVVGGSILSAWPFVIAAIVTGGAATIGAVQFRRERIFENEEEARNARYSYPDSRKKTIEALTLPDDVKEAALALVGETEMKRFDVVDRLSIRVGDVRANQYLPVILQQGDRTVVRA